MNIAVPNIAALGFPQDTEAGYPQWPRGAKRYVAALLADIRLAPYGKPDMVMSRYKAWLIVQRRGPGGSVLSLGFAGEENVNGRKAPLRLRTVTTRTALLFTETETTAEFLFNRTLPHGETVEGVFEPCEGYGRIEAAGRSVRLTAFGRLANHAVRTGGAATLAESSDPLPLDGVSWRISAVRKPWAGEVIGV